VGGLIARIVDDYDTLTAFTTASEARSRLLKEPDKMDYAIESRQSQSHFLRHPALVME
jgi:hypothetical protein